MCKVILGSSEQRVTPRRGVEGIIARSNNDYHKKQGQGGIYGVSEGGGQVVMDNDGLPKRSGPGLRVWRLDVCEYPATGRKAETEQIMLYFGI